MLLRKEGTTELKFQSVNVYFSFQMDMERSEDFLTVSKFLQLLF